MRVYIALRNDESIGKVFSTEEAAQGHIINRLKTIPGFGDLLQHQLEEMSLEYIEEHEVIEP